MRAIVRACTSNSSHTSIPLVIYARTLCHSVFAPTTPQQHIISAHTIHRRDLSSATGFNHARQFNSHVLSKGIPTVLDGAPKAASHTLEGADTTIFALSTPPGKSAIAVVRISGPACLDIYRALCPRKPLPKPRHATLRVLHAPTTFANAPPEVLDPGALILYFPAPRSTTGEDILELHLHGGPAIVRSVLSAISACPTHTSHSAIRYAEPGEFTRRAFLNDRLSLPQIEALGDTLSATTEQQRKLSLRGAGMNLTSLYEGWRRQLVEARGELEALIDFSEDQSFEIPPRDMLAGVTKGVEVLKSRMKAFVDDAVRGELLRDGISICLVGAPNVGKSSLLNRIVGRDAVIVSREAGTTRDVVDLSVDLGGYVMIVGDTAGLRIGDVVGEGENGGGSLVGDIEKEGIRRARRRVMDGDVVVVVLGVEEDQKSREISLPIPQEVVDVVKEAMAAEKPKELIVAVNKMDLLHRENIDDGIREDLPPISDIFRKKIRARFPSLSDDLIVGISCHNTLTSTNTSSNTFSNTNKNIQSLLHILTALFARMTSASTSSPEAEDSLAATTRQRLLVEACLEYLDKYLIMVSVDQNSSHGADDVDVVLAAEELRSAAECLSKITGRGAGGGDVEEVLGVVFERFCVGK